MKNNIRPNLIELNTMKQSKSQKSGSFFNAGLFAILFRRIILFGITITLNGPILAAANEAPVFITPSSDDYSVMAGHLLHIPIEIVEPENDEVEYEVEYLSSSELPKRAQLQQSGITGKWAFTWMPQAKNIGDDHVFRLQVKDEFGAEAVKEIKVNVEKATGDPSIFVSTEHKDTLTFDFQSSPILIKVRENKSLEFRIDVAGASGNPISLDIDLQDEAGDSVTLTFKKPPKRWMPTSNTYYIKHHMKKGTRGIYSGEINARDEITNQVTSIPITINVDLALRRKNSREDPYAVINIHDPGTETPEWAVVSGITPLDIEFKGKYGRGGNVSPDLIANTSLRYVLFIPPNKAEGIDENEMIGISPILKNDYSFNWDTTAVPDGTYVLGVKWIDGPHLNNLRMRTPQIVIDNGGGGPKTGTQKIPVTGFYFDDDFPQSNRPDWVSFSGRRKPSRVHPYPYKPIPSAKNLPNPKELIGDNTKWFVESLLHTNGGIYNDMPGFVQTTTGHLVSEGFYAQSGPTVERALKRTHPQQAYWDLGRGRATVSPYSTFVPIPGNEPGWYGVDISGRVFRLGAKGQVTTLAGYVTQNDGIVPHDRRNKNLSFSQVITDQAQLVGDFTDHDGQSRFFYKTVDLAVDPFNPNIIYIADAANHRIAKLEFDLKNTKNNRITTYAGGEGFDAEYGVSGYRDGPGDEALFHEPYSIDINPKTGVMYVADRVNNAIRRIDPPETSDGVPMVSTVVGGPDGPNVPSQHIIRGKDPENLQVREDLTADAKFSRASINYPQALRLDSKGNVIFLEDWTRSIRRINFDSERVERIAWMPDGHWGTWVWLDVDTEGNIGPKDDILVAMSETLGTDHRSGERYSNTLVFRYPADGSRPRSEVVPPGSKTISMKGYAPNVKEPVGHYPWAVAIDDVEARFVITGFGSSGVYSLRIKMPDDPVEFNPERFEEGWKVHETGTVLGFPFGVRPALSEMYGFRGFNLFGDSVLNFDDIALLKENVNPVDPDGTPDSRAFRNNVDIAKFIRRGMDGAILRPEITGRDLASYIYYIRYYSLEGELRNIDIDEIEEELHNEGLHDLDDLRSPEIRNVSVDFVDGKPVKISWQTDEPTIGLVEYGPTLWHGLYSKIESEFSKEHSVEIHDLIHDGISKGVYHFSIRTKDLAGNFTSSEDATFSINKDTGPSTAKVTVGLSSDVTPAKNDNNEEDLPDPKIPGPGIHSPVKPRTLSRDNLGEIISSSIYEDAEDNSTKRWHQYNQGSVKNVSGGANGSKRAIEIIGNPKSDVFILRDNKGHHWNNKNEFVAEFSIALQDPSSCSIYFKLLTSSGIRYLVYTAGEALSQNNRDLIFFGLGDIADGQWHTIVRNLEEDLKRKFPNLQLLQVKHLFVYGSAKLDDIKLLKLKSDN